MSRPTSPRSRPLVLLVDSDVPRARRHSLGLRLGGFLVVMAMRVSDARALIELLPPAVVIAHASVLPRSGDATSPASDDLTAMGIPVVVYGATEGPASHETTDTLIAAIRRALESSGDPS